MDVRPISYKKYDITKNRFREMYYFCLQYPEWKEELKQETDTMRGHTLSGMPHGTPINALEALVIKRAQLIDKCELVEQTAAEAAPEIHQYILKAVTNEGITYAYLQCSLSIPCGKDMYYDRRRRFFWLLSKKI